MRTHEAKLKAMASELREHRAAQLGKKARGKEAEEQRQKEAYLEFEVSLPARAPLYLHKLLKTGPGTLFSVTVGKMFLLGSKTEKWPGSEGQRPWRESLSSAPSALCQQ